MKIHAINDSISSPPPLDLDQFAKELRALSDRFDLRLVSLGAMATADSKGTIYLALWTTEANENQEN
jgi:hypothetical protein